MELKPLSIPCLRGKVGEWFFYTSVMKFKDIAQRVKMPEEIDEKYIDENLKLGEWIQRKIEPKRIEPLVNYIQKQEQRFFNGLVLGIYDGEPSWQDLNISNSEIYNEEYDDTINYFSKTFGILTLSGKESIFAIDGQHRVMGIRKAVKDKKAILDDEVTVIFVAHKTDEEGKIRTRRLFSTLNRYAKPVSESEKIALSEDDNCSILTRRLIDDFKYFQNRILLNKSRSVNPNQKKAFTSIMVLYDIISTLTLEKTIPGFGFVTGKKRENYLHERAEAKDLEKDYEYLVKVFTCTILNIKSLKKFFVDNEEVDRNDLSTSILFRPIGQNILFDLLKVSLAEGKEGLIEEFFNKSDFSLSNKVWYKIFWDSETNTIITDKMRQRFVTILILEKLGFTIKRTTSDLKKLKSFEINMTDI
jgi:DNA sulfur modification protein DndB